MSHPIKEQKRVVLRAKYLRYLSKITALSLLASTLLLLGISSVFLGIFLGVFFLLGHLFPIYNYFHMGPVIFLSCSLIGLLLWEFGGRAMKKAKHMESVTVLTRETASQLPAEESLMRASSEPPVPQEDVLLRAASSSQKTPQELLLRAVSQEEHEQTF